MISFRIIKQVISKINNDQGRLFKSNFHPRVSFQMQCCHAVDSSSLSNSEPEEVEGLRQKKRVRVAILGKPNVGKSTLINQILKLNVCDVSSKTHTTQFPLKTVFVRDDTQIVFVDTPGLVTKNESRKFDLTESFTNWKESVLQEIDIVGVMVDAHLVDFNVKFGFKHFNNFLELKPSFVIWNKVDLVKNKKKLKKLMSQFAPSDSSDDTTVGSETKKVLFSKGFSISALKNEGVDEIVDYLIQQAKPYEWVVESEKPFDLPVHKLIVNLVRAKMLEILPHEVPYACTYEVEYLEENDWGEIICVALITCKYRKHMVLLVERRKKLLKQISEELEADLYKILKKVVRLRLVATSKERKKTENES